MAAVTVCSDFGAQDWAACAPCPQVPAADPGRRGQSVEAGASWSLASVTMKGGCQTRGGLSCVGQTLRGRGHTRLLAGVPQAATAAPSTHVVSGCPAWRCPCSTHVTRVEAARSPWIGGVPCGQVAHFSRGAGFGIQAWGPALPLSTLCGPCGITFLKPGSPPRRKGRKSGRKR